MTTPAMPVRMSVDDFLELVDPPGVTTELIDGEVVAMPPAFGGHGSIASEIDFALKSFARAHDLGRTTAEGGYILRRNPGVVRAPDAAFITYERLGARRPPLDAHIEGAPTLAVEVVSPGDRDGEVQRKVELWLEAGADRVWEVRPRLQAVTIHQRGEAPRTLTAGATLTSNDAGFSVDGFELLVASIFE